jgi:hypothetical protein
MREYSVTSSQQIVNSNTVKLYNYVNKIIRVNWNSYITKFTKLYNFQLFVVSYSLLVTHYSLLITQRTGGAL